MSDLPPVFMSLMSLMTFSLGTLQNCLISALTTLFRRECEEQRSRYHLAVALLHQSRHESRTSPLFQSLEDFYCFSFDFCDRRPLFADIQHVCRHVAFAIPFKKPNVVYVEVVTSCWLVGWCRVLLRLGAFCVRCSGCLRRQDLAPLTTVVFVRWVVVHAASYVFGCQVFACALLPVSARSWTEVCTA